MGVLAPASICPGLPKLVLRTSFGDLQEKAPYSCAVANSSDCHNSQRLTACAKMLNWRKFWKRGRALQVLRDFDVAPNGRAIAFPLPTRHVCKTRWISQCRRSLQILLQRKAASAMADSILGEDRK